MQASSFFKKLRLKIKSFPLLVSFYEAVFHRPIIDLYGVGLSKRVLFSYSTYHFNKKNYVAHSNYNESHVLVDVFHRLGYSVDVYNNNKEYDIDFSKYDLIFGEGLPVYQALQAKFDGKIIYYATGSHPWQCSHASLLRLVDYYQKHKYLASDSLRIQDYRWGVAASLASVVVMIGNDITRKTFENYGCKKIINIDPTFHASKIDLIERDESCLNNFLYFGSYGLLHKGLDLAVDAIRLMPDCKLHVCGYTDREKDFIVSLNLPDNVVVHGFLDINSNKFIDLIRECGFVILPSCSEGTSTAILTAMGRGGLVPVVTSTCGVDVDGFGINISDLTVSSVMSAIDACRNMEFNDYILRSERALQAAHSRYSIEDFEKRFFDSMNRLLVEDSNVK